jgi:hypothetical protein
MYCCVVQTVPFAPSSAVITIAVNGLEEATGNDTLLGLVREERENLNGEQRAESQSQGWRKTKESMFLNYESVCVDSSYCMAPLEIL